jgi:hypothetical protein
MPRYTVLIPWKNESGDHSPDTVVELSTDTPPEQVEVDKLINYGIIAPAPDPEPVEAAPENEAASTSK